MSAAVPLGFVIVVGFGVFLIAVLAVLILAYTVDVSRSARDTARSARQLVSLASLASISETGSQTPCAGSEPHDTDHRPPARQRTNQEA